MKYLKSRQDYIDRYDRATVERCRWAEKAIRETDIQKHHDKKLNKQERTRMSNAFSNLHVWFVAGEAYKKKEETISRWMKEDEARDKFQETTVAPDEIACLTCGREMFVMHKHLETDFDTPDRMIFMYDCTLGHLPRRAFYDNGEEWMREAPKCPKCLTPFKEEDQTTEDKFVTVSTCSGCGHKEAREIERMANKEKIDPDFEKDRARFCSDAEGEKYVEWTRTAHELTAILDKQKEKDNNKELYEAVAKIRRLKIMEMEELLVPVFEAAEYVRLHFKDPQITKDVVVTFTVHDTRAGRENRESCQTLQKLIKGALEPTNWRLMTDGVNYRLGMLEGRLRAYEKEEDLVKLIKDHGQ